ncbi:MAG: PD-(D/E)XK nuclease family protein, partial [Clostridia bacterium]|nr:PD-(D/E)XK nuclease family protein [Clostridia bacterium]
VALLCRGYDAYVSEKLGFPGDMLDKLYETLCSFDFFAGKTVFVDSFYGFTPQETAILERIINSAENTYVTFLCESEKQTDKCFSRGVSAALSVRRICAKNGIEYKDLFFEDDLKHDKNSGLYKISREFSLEALSKKTDGKKYGDVKIIKCGDTYAEAKCAAKIASDLITSGVLPREIAVCARNVSEFEGIIDAEFENARIPFSFDKRFDLTSTSAALFVLSAFDVYFSWSMQSVVSFLKTGLSGLDDESADELEMYMRTWNISGKKYFHEEWYMNPEGLTEDEPEKEQIDRINGAKNILLSVLDGFCERLDAAKCAKDVCDAVYMLTVDASHAKNDEIFDDGAGGIYADLLFRILDDFESAVGSEAVSPKRFYELFKFALSSADMGKIPELIDQVRFSDVSLMRTDGVKYVIILDVCDGIFPASPSANELFGDREKKLLKEAGIELSELDSERAYDEIFLAYTALCSARSGAYVLYREKDFSDNGIYPSVIVRILEKMLCISPDDVERDKFNPGDVMNFTLSDETLFECFLSLEEGSARQTLKEYFSSIPEYKEKIALAEKPDFTETPLDEGVRSSLFPNKITSSFSRLEKFNYCPFSYFCRYTLKINPESKAEIGAVETGNIVHRALELILPALAQKFAQNGKITEEDISAEADRVLEGILKNIFTYSGSAFTKRFEYTFSKLGKTVKAICGEMAEEMKVSSFVPVDFELEISDRGTVKPAKTELENGKILNIVGKIDRVDMFTDKKTGKTWVRVTDYKTGSKKFETDDVKKGFNLQMLLYLYTLLQASDGRYKDVYPAGVIYKMVMPNAKSETLAKFAQSEDPDGGVVSLTDGIVVSDMDIIFA